MRSNDKIESTLPLIVIEGQEQYGEQKEIQN